MTDFTSQPATKIVAANLSNTDPLTNGPCRYFFVEAAGDVKFVPNGQTDAVTMALAAGVQPFTASQIHSTGTTATGIFACYTD
jgi:hypothetical protein